MQLSHPLEALSSALNHAAYLALPEMVYETRDNHRYFALTDAARRNLQERQAKGEDVIPMKTVHRRPAASECAVVAMFPQTWGSTALGFGGLGGQAVTAAYTTIIEGPGRERAVYWQGRLAYVVEPAKTTAAQAEAFKADLARCTTVRVSDAGVRYGATPRTLTAD